VEAVTGGYNQPADVRIAGFSSWGPTDDGRIKPDLVANGVAVFSPGGASDSAYTTLNGTSMATPNVAGTLVLLQEYYASLHNGAFMRAATLKGLAIHAADEAVRPRAPTTCTAGACSTPSGPPR
jgi:subtilisin family serine protease